MNTKQAEVTMPRKSQRVAYPLTFLLKKEGELWASLTPEMGVASCGDSLEHAREMLKSAIRASYRVMVEKGWEQDIWRTMTPEHVEDFKSDPPGEVVIESYVMVVTAPAEGEQPVPRTSIRIEFIPSASPAAQCGCGRLANGPAHAALYPPTRATPSGVWLPVRQQGWSA